MTLQCKPRILRMVKPWGIIGEIQEDSLIAQECETSHIGHEAEKCDQRIQRPCQASLSVTRRLVFKGASVKRIADTIKGYDLTDHKEPSVNSLCPDRSRRSQTPFPLSSSAPAFWMLFGSFDHPLRLTNSILAQSALPRSLTLSSTFTAQTQTRALIAQHKPKPQAPAGKPVI
jgi:hypothetical protein